MLRAKFLCLLAVAGAASLAPVAAGAAIDQAGCAALAKAQVEASAIGMTTGGATVETASLVDDPGNG